jgi:2-oxo-3-hexenedioate decarboxylase/2-keto-4-pentenoate hydratase
MTLMADSRADAAAVWLLAQHDQRAHFRGIEPWPAAPDEGYAYAVQDGWLALRQARRPDTVAGYKIGLTTPRMQKLCRGDRPISGVMQGSGVRRSPARVAAGDFVHLGVESELAVRTSRPLPAGGAPVTRADVAAAVGEIAAAFELIEDRHADYSTLDWLWMAAENSWHAGLVLGPSVAPCDVADLPGVLAIDGVEADRGSTRDVLGHPYDAVAWLATHLRARGRSIEPGDWISTGSIATIRFAEVGRSYRFTIAGLPPVELAIA